MSLDKGALDPGPSPEWRNGRNCHFNSTHGARITVPELRWQCTLLWSHTH